MIPSFRSYGILATQTSQVLSRWTKTTWPASLVWRLMPSNSSLACATLEGRLACFARRARGPSRCHADRLSGLRISVGLIASQTPLPGCVFSRGRCTASAPVTQARTFKFSHSISHSQAFQREAKLYSPLRCVSDLNLLGRPHRGRAGCVNKEWPEVGWQRGTVARPCPRGAFSHVVPVATRQTTVIRRCCAARRTRCSIGSHGGPRSFDYSRTQIACDSRMAVSVLTRATCKMCDTNHIPRATARPTALLRVRLSLAPAAAAAGVARAAF